MIRISPSTWTRLATLGALSMVWLACKTTAPDTRTDHASSTTHAPGLRLPALPLASLAHPKGCVRIGLGDALETDGLTLPLDGRHIPESALRGMLVHPLFEALTVHPLVRSRCVALRADVDTPYRTVAHVLYTAGQARYDAFWVVTQGHNGAAAFPLHMPKIEVARADDPLHTGGCRQALGRVTSSGARLDLRPGSDRTTMEKAEPPRHKPGLEQLHKGSGQPLTDLLTGLEPRNLDAVFAPTDAPDIVVAPTARPTPPRPQPGPAPEADPYPSTAIGLREGHQDFAGIRDWLADHHSEDSCQTGFVVAPDTLSWGDVATVLAAFSAAHTVPALAME